MIFRKSSEFDRHFCVVLSHFLPATERLREKGQAVAMGTTSMSFVINLMLTFLMESAIEEERLIWDLLFQALDQFMKEK